MMTLRPDPTLLPRLRAEARRRGLVAPTPKARATDSALDLARKSVLAFTGYTKQDYKVNWHHRVMCEKLDRFVNGEIKRLLVFMPPRHGKSELVSRRLPAYIFGRLPDVSVIACSYGADLSSRMNRDVQRVMDSAEYRALFPDTQLSGQNVRTVAQGSYLRNSDIFEIVGRRGSYRSAGVGGGITGMGFDFGIIDDPVKSKKEAESVTFRDAVWEWYTSDFYTRQEGNAGILITTTRWHDDDLAGRLLNQAKNDPTADQWEVINFPALFEQNNATTDDPRSEGEALWPDKFNVARLEKTKTVLGRAFYALYQQRPQPREGGLFKLAHLQLVAAVPAQMRRVRYWDKAATKGGGDYTAGVLMGEAGGRYYVEDVIRGQWETAERNAIIRNTAAQDRLKYGHVDNVTEEEPGSSGKDASRAFITMLAGFSVAVERVTGSKEVRAVPFSDQWAANNVFVLQAPWTNNYVDELTAFPTGAHDDQVDPSAGAFSKLALGKTDWEGASELGKVEVKSRWQ